VKTNRRSEAILVGAMAVVAAVVAMASSGSAWRTLSAAPLVLCLPGYAIVSALFPDEPISLEKAVFAVGLSIATTIIWGLLLHFADALTCAGWALSLSGTTVAVTAIAPVISRPLAVLTPRRPGAWPVDKWRAACLVGSAVITIAAIHLAREGASAHREYSFTEFWMVPNSPDDESLLTIGLKNFEKVPASYDIEITIDGEVVDLWRSISLQPEELWTRDMSVPSAAQPIRRVEAWLFKDSNRNLVYRKVWFDVASSEPRRTVTE